MVRLRLQCLTVSIFAILLCFTLLVSVQECEGARRDRPRITYFNMKAVRRPELHIPRIFRSNSGATKPIRKSDLKNARGAFPRYQYVHSTFSKAIETKRRVAPRAYDRKIELDLPAKLRSRAQIEAAKQRTNALKNILVTRSPRRRKRATMTNQRECKGSTGMWKPNQPRKSILGALFGTKGGKRSRRSTLSRRPLSVGIEDVLWPTNLNDTHHHENEEELNQLDQLDQLDFDELELELYGDGDGGGGTEEVRHRRKLEAATRSGRGGRPVVEHPLDKFCAREKSINVTGPVDKGEELLVKCLESGKKCSGFTKQEFELIEKTLSKFDGIYFLRNEKPKCVAMNQKSCSSAFGNLETGVDSLTRRDRDLIRRASGSDRFSLKTSKDLTTRFKSCAIVGNAPSLARDKFGKYIDQFDAVFRLNHVQGFNPEKKFPKRAGTRTTFRLFSKLPSFSLATGNLQVKPTTRKESWLFWHDMSRYYIPGIEKQDIDAPILMMSPYQINWQVKVYFALRREMVRLGLGPFQCPHNINSGLHAVLLAQNMCKTIGVFGLSYEEKHASGGGHFGNKQHVMSKKHDWGFDTLVLRVLHLAKQCALCT